MIISSASCLLGEGKPCKCGRLKRVIKILERRFFSTGGTGIWPDSPARSAEYCLALVPFDWGKQNSSPGTMHKVQVARALHRSCVRNFVADKACQEVKNLPFVNSVAAPGMNRRVVLLDAPNYHNVTNSSQMCQNSKNIIKM